MDCPLVSNFRDVKVDARSTNASLEETHKSTSLRLARYTDKIIKNNRKLFETLDIESMYDSVQLRAAYIMDNVDFGLFKKKKKPKNQRDTPDGPGKTIVLPQPAGADEYSTHNAINGIAIVLNHKHIKGQATRNGTEKDRDRLQKTLQMYGFDVSVYDDLTFDEVTNVLTKAAERDFSNVNCLCVTVLSHGLPGQVFASDTYYPVEYLWDRFLGDKCPSLVGKPKLFFIQACRGTDLDTGVNFMFRSMPTEITQLTYTIPSKADLLVMYSTFEGAYSWRNSTNGSWFIQSLCIEMEVASQEDDVELIYLLTSVARRVAYDYQSNVPTDQTMNEMKQMPTFMSTLTKMFYLKKKPDEDEAAEEQPE